MTTIDRNQPVQICVTLHPSGAMSIEGPVQEKNFCIKILENAIDGIRNQGAGRIALPSGMDVLVPAKDVEV